MMGLLVMMGLISDDGAVSDDTGMPSSGPMSDDLKGDDGSDGWQRAGSARAGPIGHVSLSLSLSLSIGPARLTMSLSLSLSIGPARLAMRCAGGGNRVGTAMTRKGDDSERRWDSEG